jgi:hypothetical protein
LLFLREPALFVPLSRPLEPREWVVGQSRKAKREQKAESINGRMFLADPFEGKL